jgi:putative thioredoxin
MSHITNITESNFIQEVINESYNTPVLVDFWATWCEPCKNFMPTLTKLAEEYSGKCRVTKIEVDQEQKLATQFAIRSVPTLKMVVDGQFVDQFDGDFSEQEVRDYINKHLMGKENTPLQKAIHSYINGDTESALEQMQHVLMAEPNNPSVRIEFANILMREKRFDDARDLLNSLAAEDKNNSAALALFTQLESIDAVIDAPDFETLLQTIVQDPNNCLVREQLSAHYKLRGDFASALEQLLEIVRRDRKYNDDAGRKGLLKTFEMLGSNHELVAQYRRKLAQTLN